MLDQGSGEIVVALHCTGATRSEWRTFADDLVNFPGSPLRLIAPNLVGVGKTTRPSGDADWVSSELEMLEALLDWCGEPVHLVGHSYGGLIACMLALADSQRLHSLTLIEPAIAGRQAVDGSDAAGQHVQTRLAGFFERAGPPGGWNGLSSTQKSYLLDTADVVLAQIDAVGTAEMEPRHLSSLNVPTMIIAGSASKSDLVENATAIAGAIPNSRFSVVAGAGHMSPVTHAAQVNALIVDHLTFCLAGL